MNGFEIIGIIIVAILGLGCGYAGAMGIVRHLANTNGLEFQIDQLQTRITELRNLIEKNLCHHVTRRRPK